MPPAPFNAAIIEVLALDPPLGSALLARASARPEAVVPRRGSQIGICDPLCTFVVDCALKTSCVSIKNIAPHSQDPPVSPDFVVRDTFF